MLPIGLTRSEQALCVALNSSLTNWLFPLPPRTPSRRWRGRLSPSIPATAFIIILYIICSTRENMTAAAFSYSNVALPLHCYVWWPEHRWSQSVHEAGYDGLWCDRSPAKNTRFLAQTFITWARRRILPHVVAYPRI